MQTRVPKRRTKPYTTRERITITPDPEIMNWIQRRIGPGKRFGSYTHAFESGIAALIEAEDET